MIERVNLEIQTIVRLYQDGRMPLWLKAVPVVGLAFMVNPVDLPGLMDDLIVLVICTVVFYGFSPKGLAEEHRNRLRNQIEGEWREAATSEEKIIDGQFRVDDNQNDHKKD